MRDAPWRTLIRELTDAGYESPYLDRLRQRLDVAQAHESLEREILHEMACALGRAEDKLNAALLRLELAANALRTAAPEQRRAHATAFNACRRAALAARWELVIHREAIGLRRNELLERLYPIPPAAPVDDAAQ
jgi:hypothetical protein